MGWWSSGVMEEWSDGGMERKNKNRGYQQLRVWQDTNPIAFTPATTPVTPSPTLQHSVTPTLRYSNTPLLHHSVTPSLRYSITPLLHHSVTPSLHSSLPPAALTIPIRFIYFIHAIYVFRVRGAGSVACASEKSRERGDCDYPAG
jgi:hypothetical protein